MIGDLYKPASATRANPAPAILTTNGFGGSKDDQAKLARAFAARGYVVLSYSGLGFGGSGCKITLDDRDYDGKAGSQLVSFLGGGGKAVDGTTVDYVRAIRAQLLRHRGQGREHLAVPPRELPGGRRERRGDALPADADDLAHEAVEEDRVARLVGLLGGQEVRLLLARSGVDVRREVVGDGVLAVEEERVEPPRRAALLLGELLVPVDLILGEVDLHRRPVALLPAGIEV